MNSNEAKPISVCCQIAKIYSPKPIKSDNNNSGKGFFNFNFKTKVSKRNSFKTVNLNVNKKKLEKVNEKKKNFLDTISCEEIEKNFKTLKLDLFEDEIKEIEEIVSILNETKAESNESSPQNILKTSRPQNPFYKNFEEE
jgi:hypothetical protein